MRITYVYDNTFPSSAADAWQVINTVSTLSRQGANVRLAFCESEESPNSGEELLAHYGLEGDIELMPVPLKSARLSGLAGRTLVKLTHPAQAVMRTIAKDTDLVFSRNIPAVVMANLVGRPVEYDTYRPWPSQYRAMAFFFRTLFRSKKMLGAFFHSEHAMNSFANAGISPEKLRVAHNGYNESFFDPPLSTREAREALGMDPDDFVIGYTGRLDLAKGIGALLDIAEHEPSFQFLLVGHGEQAVMDRIERIPNVKLFPWQTHSKLPTYLYACDCLMIPPSSIPLRAGNTVLPIKLFTYFASGRVIVAPRAPDTEELLKHDENSWLLRCDDTVESVKQLQYLRENPELRKRLSDKAREQSREMTWTHRAQFLLTQIDGWMRSSNSV
ncbi:MAG: glycosyltransferase family 4 protein [Kofleriaceae bacterium]|nr:glycosyltransferase family 4 protein [Kofleriaceae bacterium]